MAANDVAVNILLNARDNTKPAIDSATANVGRLEKGISASKIAFGALSGGAAAGLIGALSDVARAAAEDEANVEKLRVAVENSGVAWTDNVGIINARIKAGQGMAFTDTQIRDSLSVLTAQTGSLDEALKRQTLAMDFARGTGMDLYAASKLMGKVTDENVKVFGRWGITVKAGATETELFGLIQQKFGGQAETYGNTTSASIFKVKDSIDEWRESIGTSMGPAMGFIALLPGLSAGMTLAGSAAGALSTALGLTTAEMLAAAAPIVAVTVAVVAVGLALYSVWQVIDLVRENWDTFTYALTRGDLNDIPIFGFFFHAAQNVIGLLQTIQNLWNAVSSAFGGGASNAAAVTNDFAFGSYATGTPYVPQDGLAYLHRGEAVIPASQNRGGGQTIVTQVFLNGRQIADAVGETFTQDRRMQGLA